MVPDEAGVPSQRIALATSSGVFIRAIADNNCRIVFLSTHADGKFLGAFDDVIVRQNVTLLIQYRSRTGAFLWLHKAKEVARI